MKEFKKVSSEFNEKNYSSKMDKSIQSFKKDISTLRTGRANINMLDTIKVDVYGQMMPINQLATVGVPEARLITVQVWDQANVKSVDAAIHKSDLGINPQIDGSLLRLRIPDLTEERRKEMIKVLKNIGEKNKVAVRNIRREANDELKKLIRGHLMVNWIFFELNAGVNTFFEFTLYLVKTMNRITYTNFEIIFKITLVY